VLRLPVLTLALLSAFSLSTAAHSVSQNAQASQKPVDAVPQQARDNRSSSSNRAVTMAPSQPATSARADTPPRDGPNNPEVRTPQPTAPSVTADPAGLTGSGTLKICLRMPDDSAFSGSASVHVMPSEGYEVSGTPSESDGEMIFAGMQPGTYTIEVSAPGFLTVRQKLEIDPGNRVRTQFVVMKNKPLPAREIEELPAPPASTSSTETQPTRASWIPQDIDDLVPDVQPGVECPLPHVIKGVGLRMNQLVMNLQKFSATERVEHFMVDATGVRHGPESRTFDYVVVISVASAGLFALDEYRNGSVDPAQFPARVATEGLSGMALIFHPLMVSGFNFSCEGLSTWNTHPAWQVHFAQRPDRPNRIRVYVIGGQSYPVPLKGRAWIDAATYQVLRLESELMKPVQDIGLTQEHLAIDYGQVKFRTHSEQLWLPLDAEVYAERRGHRYYRRHTFSDFKIFTVETDQSIRAPKESYCFTNTSDHDIAGVLVVSPVSGISLKAVSIRFIVPPGKSIYKVVGPGKDISMPVDEVGSATFTHNGTAESIKADAYLVKESTLDVIADSPISINP
jgi:Carboxypeptidase regulatory-like domain